MLSAQLLPGSAPEEQAEQVETILTTTRRMQRLIQDLLDATKAENSSLSIRHDVIEPASVAKEVAAGQASIAEQKHVRFETNVGNALKGRRRSPLSSNTTEIMRRSKVPVVVCRT